MKEMLGWVAAGLCFAAGYGLAELRWRAVKRHVEGALRDIKMAMKRAREQAEAVRRAESMQQAMPGRRIMTAAEVRAFVRRGGLRKRGER